MVICSVVPRRQISCLPLRASVQSFAAARRLSCLSVMRGEAVGWGAVPSLKGDGHHVISEAVSVGACEPGCLYGDGQVVAHGLGGGLSLAPCPYDLAGLEAGGGGHDHGSVCRLLG